MRFTLLIPFLFLFLLSSFSKKETGFASSKKQIIGVYDRDSLLNEMPAYKHAMDSLAFYRTQLDSMKFLMFDELYKKRAEFYKDSAGYSAVIKQIKNYEIMELRSRIGEFSVAVKEEEAQRTQEIKMGCDQQITAAATKLRLEKNMPVMDKKQLADSLSSYRKAKVINVSNEMRPKLGIVQPK